VEKKLLGESMIKEVRQEGEALLKTSRKKGETGEGDGK
jgi:hypothetical protein